MSLWWSATVAVTVAFAGTVASAPVVLDQLRRHGVIDRPGPRSTHRTATLRGAGIAMVAPAAAGTVLAGTSWEFGAPIAVVAGLAVVGLADDVRSRTIRFRLVCQVLAAVLLAVWFADDLALVDTVLAGAFIVGYINATNFMDGINGITSAHGIVAGSALAIAAAVHDAPATMIAGLILAGCCAGFLPLNFPVARAFPGDAGAYFVGASVGTTLYIGLAEGVPWPILLGPTALYVADTAFTLVRRLLAAKNIREPHRDHAYQRILDSGWSQERTVAVVTAVTAAAAAGGFLATVVPVAGVSVVVLVLSLYLSLPWLTAAEPITV